MKTMTFPLYRDDEYHYTHAMGFVPNLHGYLHEDDKKRPGMIVVPGGAYTVVSPTEGEIVAKIFYAKGFQSFVLTYTTDLLCSEPLLDQPMKDLSRAVCFIRKEQKELCLDPQKIVVTGFSAGAHAVGSLCVHYKDLQDASVPFSNRPDAAILSYPVISMRKFVNMPTRDHLLGQNPDPDLVKYYSLETQVEKDCPPCFLWHTAEDTEVPPENSIMMEAALREKGVRHALHIFSRGPHGLSLANQDWCDGKFGEPYTLEQTFTVGKAIQEGTVQASAEVKKMLAFFATANSLPVSHPDPEVQKWPQLAMDFLGWIKEGNHE